jgi:regulatory protein
MTARRPTVTALRAESRARVAVEVDGDRWRTLPAEVVLRAGLGVGRTLDRPVLRLLRRELRRVEALDAAGRALRTRDLSSRRLAERLARAAVAPAARTETLATLERTGLIDDGRFARNRASALAARGYGDVTIRLDLERHGVEIEIQEEAIAALEPELERAREVVRRRGAGARTVRYLAGKGFAEEVVTAVVGLDFASDP